MTDQSYYVQFRAADGTTLYSADGDSWFEVTDPSFATQTPIDSNGQFSAGTISFGDLSFDLQANTALPTIFENLAAGQAIAAVELADYVDFGNGPTLASDDIFSTANLTSLSTSGAVTTLSLGYSTLQEEVPIFRNGTPEPPAGVAWDSATNLQVPITTPAAATTQQPEYTGDPASLTYFVQFRAANGSIVTAANGDSWFAVSGVSFSEDKTSSTSKVTFGGLSFTLQNSAVLPTLFLDETQGLRISQIELAGYNIGGGNNDLVQDDFFGTAILQHNAIGAGGADTLSFGYGALVEQTYSPASGGIISLIDGAGWSVLLNSATSTPAYARAAPLTAEPTVTSPITPDLYFVQFRNAAGQALAGANGDTWFAIQAPDISTSATPKASFAPLTLQLAAPDVYPALLKDLTAGQDFSAVEIAGYAGGTSATLAQDDILQTVSVTGITDAGLLTLSYSGLQEQADSAHGAGSIAATGNFSTATNAVAGNLPIDAAASTLPATESSPGALTYFVQLRGAGGAILTGDNGATWFAVENPAASQDYVGSSVVFGTLGLTLEAGSELPKSFLDEASQTPFTQIELAAYSAGGYLVQDDLYGTASVIEDTANGDGSGSLAFNYQTVINNSYSRVGATDTISGTAGWNLATRAADTTPAYAAAAPLSGLPATAYSQTAPAYYVQFVTAGGATLSAPGGIDWFSIGNLSFSSSDAANKLQFGNLSFSIGPDAILPSLLTDIASGAVITKVEIAGYAGGGTPQLVQDDIFEDATVNTLSTNAAGTVSLGLTFSTLQEQSDSASPATTVGWDSATKTQPGAIAIAAPTLGEPAAQAAPGALTYYVQIKQANGTILTGPNDSTWFAVTNIGDEQTNSVSTNGTPSANLSFGALSFSLPEGTELPTIFLDEAKDIELGQIELAGYATGASNTLVVDDLFDNGFISATTNGGEDGTAGISFSYDEFVQQSYTDTGGTVALAESGGWNKAANAAATAPEFAAAAPLDSPPTDVACFAAGTRIRTARGEIAVEDLAPGDEVITSSGRQPIKWIGQRHFDLSRHPHPEKARPIRLEAGCLAANIPARDLFLSPDHALYLDGILVPAKALLNGASIRQIAAPRVTYYHIELADHSVIFAENTPAETYLETGNRGAFENGPGAMTLHPDFAQCQREAKSCAPFLQAGPQVEAIRAKILARANMATTDDPAIGIAYHKGAAIISSRHAIPGLTTPDPRDRRRLGVKIARLEAGGRDIPLDHPALVQGWHAAEPDGRWTNGHAVIPPELIAGRHDIKLTLAATLEYPVAA
jgi:type VI protein secretion system component Hcp